MMAFAMQTGAKLVTGVLILVGFVAVVLVRKERRKRLAAFSTSRAEMPIEVQHQLYYSEYLLSEVSEVINSLALVYGVAPTSLRPEDRFEEELRSLTPAAADIKYEIVCSCFRRRRRNMGISTTEYPKTIADYISGVLNPADFKGKEPCIGA